ncbi:MAG: energy transducer TonB [Pseudomonadota bacterium]|nr:energy transducer TonB [Pseudomonadota bacterium]
MMTRPQVKRLVPLILIILLHIGFFHALLNGLLYQTEQALPKAEQALPKEIFVSLITVDNPPEPTPPEPQPTPPKPVPVIKQTVTPPPIIPVINKTPSEQAITTPPVPPQPTVVVPPTEPVPSAAPAPAPPPPPSQPKTVSTGVEYLQAPAPEYPPIARRMGEEGRVTLRVLVNENGRPTRVDVQKTSGSPRLDEAARQSVLHAMFKPHIEDGRAITVYAIVPITFHLDN